MVADSILASIAHELKSNHHCHTLILYGSRARSSASENSDYDLAGFSDSINSTVQIARSEPTYFLDAFIYPTSFLQKPDASMLHLEGGVILFEKENWATLFLKGLQELLAAGPKRLTADVVEGRIVWYEKMIKRIEVGDIEGKLRRAILTSVFLEDYLTLLGQWYRGPKTSLIWLKDNRPDVYEVYASALTRDSIEPIKQLSEYIKTATFR